MPTLEGTAENTEFEAEPLPNSDDLVDSDKDIECSSTAVCYCYSCMCVYHILTVKLYMVV